MAKTSSVFSDLYYVKKLVAHFLVYKLLQMPDLYKDSALRDFNFRKVNSLKHSKGYLSSI